MAWTNTNISAHRRRSWLTKDVLTGDNAAARISTSSAPERLNLDSEGTAIPRKLPGKKRCGIHSTAPKVAAFQSIDHRSKKKGCSGLWTRGRRRGNASAAPRAHTDHGTLALHIATVLASRAHILGIGCHCCAFNRMMDVVVDVDGNVLFLIPPKRESSSDVENIFRRTCHALHVKKRNRQTANFVET